MYRYLLTFAAKDDLENIKRYIAEDDKQISRRVIKDIRQLINEIVDFPLKYRLRNEVADGTLRFAPIYSYVIVYQATDNPIKIIRILHTRRDLPSMFK